MKPIIVDIDEMTESIEVYKSDPNFFITIFTYGITAIFIIVIVWMWIFKIEVVVKCNGIIRSEDTIYKVSSVADGVITECNISEGQYVKEGETLFEIDAEMIKENVIYNEKQLENVNERIEILRAYSLYLDGEENALESCSENKYYSEFVERKLLLELKEQDADSDIKAQKGQYNKEMENVSQLIEMYNNQINKLTQVKECILLRTNKFTVEDSYYESMVSSYISNYNVTASHYDIQINDYRKEIENIERQIEQLLSNTDEEKIDELNRQIAELQNIISQISGEKEANLANLELQQLTTIEQQIANINTNISIANSNKISFEAQVELLDDMEEKDTNKIIVLTEKQKIETEILSYETKQDEYEAILKKYNFENGNASVTAYTSGYIVLEEELNVGSYVTQGSPICRIYPENTSGYYAEIYVGNKDIAKLKEGQKVKFEIEACPSSEYGYFVGTIENISKDVKVDQTSGSAYYLVKVRCEENTVTNKDGKSVTIMNGMACEAKIIVEEEKILKYLLEKLNF